MNKKDVEEYIAYKEGDIVCYCDSFSCFGDVELGIFLGYRKSPDQEGESIVNYDVYWLNGASSSSCIHIELDSDDICKPCKHNINGLCDDTIDTSFRPKAPKSKREWNLLIDRRWCKHLKIKQGDRLTARQLCKQLRSLGGNIVDIYREIPADMTHERARKLKKGIKEFLQE